MLLYVVSLYYIYTLLYIKKEQMNQSRERANERTEQEERTRAKDSAVIFASSSPLFCSVCCLHRPLHRQPLTTSPACVSAQGDGRAATSSDSGRCHRHHIASEQQPQGSASTVCHPALLVLVLVLFIQVVRKGIANEQTEQEEREPGRRLPPTSSPVLPFRLRLRFLLFFALISSACSHLFALPSSCSSFLALLPAY